MPYKQPTISFQSLRNICEQWTWRDPRTGVQVTGFNPPKDARQKQQKPFYIRYITSRGIVEQGEVICLKVDLLRHQRMVKYTSSGQCRWVRDYLVISVDGMRVLTH